MKSEGIKLKASDRKLLGNGLRDRCGTIQTAAARVDRTPPALYQILNGRRAASRSLLADLCKLAKLKLVIDVRLEK